MAHDDDSTFLPLLNRKMLDIDMSQVGSRFAFIDHGNCGDVIFVEWCWVILGYSKLKQNGTKMLGNLGSMNGSNELSFGRTRGNSSLQLGLIRNGTTCKAKDKARDRSSSCNISGICSIDEAD
jgi:hypothetical protein